MAASHVSGRGASRAMISVNFIPLFIQYLTMTHYLSILSIEVDPMAQKYFIKIVKRRKNGYTGRDAVYDTAEHGFIIGTPDTFFKSLGAFESHKVNFWRDKEKPREFDYHEAKNFAKRLRSKLTNLKKKELIKYHRNNFTGPRPDDYSVLVKTAEYWDKERMVLILSGKLKPEQWMWATFIDKK